MVGYEKYRPSDKQIVPQVGVVTPLRSRDVFKFWEIIDKISEMVQDRDS